MSGAERHKDKCVFYPFIYLHLFDVHGIGGYFALVLMFWGFFFRGTSIRDVCTII